MKNKPLETCQREWRVYEKKHRHYLTDRDSFKAGWNAALRRCAEIARNPETWKKLAEKGGIANVTVAGKAIASAIEREMEE